jgi:hypothetical protein
MPMSTYQVVTQTVTVPADANGQPNTYTLTAPTGKKPLAGGYRDHIPQGQGDVRVTGSYPSGQTWVFEIVGASFDHTVDLYLTTATV